MIIGSLALGHGLFLFPVVPNVYEEEDPYMIPNFSDDQVGKQYQRVVREEFDRDGIVTGNTVKALTVRSTQTIVPALQPTRISE